jgi:hypothetical protein
MLRHLANNPYSALTEPESPKSYTAAVSTRDNNTENPIMTEDTAQDGFKLVPIKSKTNSSKKPGTRELTYAQKTRKQLARTDSTFDIDQVSSGSSPEGNKNKTTQQLARLQNTPSASDASHITASQTRPNDQTDTPSPSYTAHTSSSSRKKRLDGKKDFRRRGL